MKTKLIIIILFFFSISAFAQNTHILPTPQQVETAEGQFVWDENVVLTYDASDAEISQIILLFRNDLDLISGKKVQFSRGVIKGKHFVELIKTDHLGVSENEDQAYRLTVNPSFIRMEATSSAAFMRPLAEKALLDKDFVDVAYFEPFYLKDFVAGKPHVKGLV